MRETKLDEDKPQQSRQHSRCQTWTARRIARCWLDGDNDKLLVEYQQDIDINIGIESKLPKLDFERASEESLRSC